MDEEVGLGGAAEAMVVMDAVMPHYSEADMPPDTPANQVSAFTFFLPLGFCDFFKGQQSGRYLPTGM